MPLESATHISDFVLTNPDGTVDTVASLDNHIRMMKTVFQTDFPGISGPVTATHTELNYVDGVTSAIQTQLDAKAGLSSPTFTGTPAAPTAAAGTATTQIATTAFVAATGLSSALPGQTGNAGKFVTTDGTTASWSSVFPDQTGNSGEFLTTNGTDASWSAISQATAANGSSLVLLATLTPTAAANVDALSTFTSSYDNYLIVGQGLKPASTDSLRLRFATGGAADTGSNYVEVVGAPTTLSAAAATSAVSGAVLAAGKGASFILQVINANEATNVKMYSSTTVFQENATPTYTGRLVTGMYIGGAMSGVRFYWSAGQNFSATGSIRIYGYKNS